MRARLRRAQGPFEPKPVLPIIDELILTVMSQATSDTNRDRAFGGLKAKFSSWEAIRDAPVEEVVDAIRSGGIAEVKARRIQVILRTIEEREGSLDLSRLHSLSDQDVHDYLCSLPGVGPKTSACVLVFAMERNAFPIDTHVHRVSTRLGWIDGNISAEAAHFKLAPKVPPEIRYDLHMALIEHGRKICLARTPRCSECVLLDLCEAGPRLVASGAAR